CAGAMLPEVAAATDARGSVVGSWTWRSCRPHPRPGQVLMPQRNAVLLNGKPLKFALFGSNCSAGRTYANVPELWDASWENNLRLAKLADEIGIEALVPIARWKGHEGETNPNGTSFESIAWAGGL